MSNPILQEAQRTLRWAMLYFFFFAAIAVYAGVKEHPSPSYTAGAAIIGVVWTVLLVASWRLRPNWSIGAAMVFILGSGFVRDWTFPGEGLLQGIYGIAVGMGAGMFLLGVFRGKIARFSRLDREEPGNFSP